LTPRTSSAGGPAEALRRLSPVDIVIAGGGTGGHTSPGLAVAALLRERSRTCAWIGSRSGIEAQQVPRSGIPYVAISTGKLRRYWAWQNVADLLVNVPVGTLSVLRILRTLRPRVVFGTGGFVALPVVFAAALLRLPVAQEVEKPRKDLLHPAKGLLYRGFGWSGGQLLCQAGMIPPMRV